MKIFYNVQAIFSFQYFELTNTTLKERVKLFEQISELTKLIWIIHFITIPFSFLSVVSIYIFFIPFCAEMYKIIEDISITYADCKCKKKTGFHFVPTSKYIIYRPRQFLYFSKKYYVVV